MKYLLILTLLIPYHVIYGQSQENESKQTFFLSGDAILRIQPNQVSLTLGVIKRGKELLPTKHENYDIIKNAIKYCKKEGIPEKYIQTDYIRINPKYNHHTNTDIDSYEVVQTISILLSDLEKYEQFLTELLEIGINQVYDIQFRTTEMEKYRYEVRKMAIKAAKDKAQFLAGEVGIKLGDIINIRESINLPSNSFNSMNYANFAANTLSGYGNGTDDSALSIGLISLKATVNLTYEIK